MTQYTIRTSEAEAKEIVSGAKRFVFRREDEPYKRGDLVTFRVYKNEKPCRNEIDTKAYFVTCVGTSNDYPIAKGTSIIGFREVTK